MTRKWLALTLALSLLLSCLTACSGGGTETATDNTEPTETAETTESTDTAAVSETQTAIETALNLRNNEAQAWTYGSGGWTLSVVSAVAYPELPDQQGVSVCVPGAYVKGIDTDGDGTADVTADTATDTVTGALVIDYDAQITSANGQTYTAATAPVILNTGAAGYSSSTNTAAAATYVDEGYINVSCGNRGKQDTVTDADGNTTYTGDAPCCLVDQKNAARFVRYNILLGNLPGSVDYWVSTGGSGGGAHAVMFAATSDNPAFYDYEIAAGAVGVYRQEDGSYTTSVTIDGERRTISDGAWGCMAYSAITSLAEADMALAFEYNLDATYSFSTDYQAKLASFLSASYMEYINAQNLTVNESAVGFDLNGDGDREDDIVLTIEYDPDAHPETRGYYGTYLDLYLAEFRCNLQWYLDNLDYAEGWTWFDADGSALSDDAVAAMTTADKAAAFLEGRYAKGSSGGMGGFGDGQKPDGAPDGMTGPGDGNLPDRDSDSTDTSSERSFDNSAVAENSAGDTMDVGTPDAGTTQAAGSSTDSSSYASYAEMLSAYQSDIAEIQAGDAYGNNIVELYNPLNYIGAEGTNDPAWVRILMGASEGDMSMFSSLNLQLSLLKAGVDANIAWQWDGGHVPSEVLSDSFSLYVDQMYAAHATGTAIETPAAQALTANGTAESATGTELTGWVDSTDLSNVTFTLAAAAAYRTAGASKAMPAFDVIDYGQEDYVFGSSTQDARHWNSDLLAILEQQQETLEPLFNQG